MGAVGAGLAPPCCLRRGSCTGVRACTCWWLRSAADGSPGPAEPRAQAASFCSVSSRLPPSRQPALCSDWHRGFLSISLGSLPCCQSCRCACKTWPRPLWPHPSGPASPAPPLRPRPGSPCLGPRQTLGHAPSGFHGASSPAGAPRVSTVSLVSSPGPYHWRCGLEGGARTGNLKPDGY